MTKINVFNVEAVRVGETNIRPPLKGSGSETSETSSTLQEEHRFLTGL